MYRHSRAAGKTASKDLPPQVSKNMYTSYIHTVTDILPHISHSCDPAATASVLLNIVVAAGFPSVPHHSGYILTVHLTVHLAAHDSPHDPHTTPE